MVLTVREFLFNPNGKNCARPLNEHILRAEVYIRAPEKFNVGKAGRNLTLSARQAVCLARGILSDVSVLMIHKPTALLSEAHSKKIMQVVSSAERSARHRKVSTMCFYSGAS